jgi:hypothetical protein
VKFRQGYPEISIRNKMFGGIKQRAAWFEGAAMAADRIMKCGRIAAVKPWPIKSAAQADP